MISTFFLIADSHKSESCFFTGCLAVSVCFVVDFSYDGFSGEVLFVDIIFFLILISSPRNGLHNSIVDVRE